MGSVASRGAGIDFARALLGEIERESRKAIAQTGEIDVPKIADILEQGLDDLAHRDAIVYFLAAYLSRCVAGSVPDYTSWAPPPLVIPLGSR